MSYTTMDNIRNLLRLKAKDVFILEPPDGTKAFTLSRWCINQNDVSKVMISTSEGIRTLTKTTGYPYNDYYVYIYPTTVMIYVSEADIGAKGRLIIEYPTDISDIEIENAITLADSRIDSMISGYYEVPFNADNIPPLITKISTYLACFYLGLKLYTQENPSIIESLKVMKDDADELLKAIMENRYPLTDKDGKIIKRKSPLLTNTLLEEHYIIDPSLEADSKIGSLFKINENYNGG